MLTLGVLIELPAATAKGADGTGVESMVVLTETVLPVPAVPLVTPRSVTSTWSPALMNALEKNVQVELWFAFGLLQLPTSTPRVTSRSVPLCHFGAVVP